MTWGLDGTTPTLDSTSVKLDHASPAPALGTFLWVPSYNSQLDDEPRVLPAKFGDGYEQRVGDGINNDLPQWSLRFDARTSAEATDIRNFLKTQGGVKVFDWTPPMGAAGKFICRKWSLSASGPLSYDISAMFEQVPA